MVSNVVCEPEKCCGCRTSRDCGALVAALTHGNPCERDAHSPARYNEEPEAVFRLAFLLPWAYSRPVVNRYYPPFVEGSCVLSTSIPVRDR